MPEFEMVFRSGAIASDDVFLAELSGREAISELYEFNLMFETTFDGHLAQEEIDDMIRRTCYVAFGRAGGIAEEHKIYGTLRSIETMPTTTGDRIQYHAVMVPRLWYTTLTHRSRIFQNKTVMQIVEAVLREYGMRAGEHYELKINQRHPEREYTVQYQETDFNFICRLMEYEGIFFYFKQTDRGDRVVFADMNEGFDRITDPITHERRGSTTGIEAITAFAQVQRQLTSKVVVRDYNYRIPAVPVAGVAPVDEHGFGYDYRYNEHSKDINDARRVARIRAQRHLIQKVTNHGRSQVTYLRAGNHITMEDHPVSSFDGDYVITEVRHHMRQRGMSDGSPEGNFGYHNEFGATPFAVAFRPTTSTPRPRIFGLINAKVDGTTPVGTAAPIDDHGRYQVVFPWDLEGQPGGGATRWIRMAQPHAGAGYGLHYPLHVGTEVVIAHIDGDPDRPLIVGSVPNMETPTPVNAELATRGRLLTRSRVLVEYEDDA